VAPAPNIFVVLADDQRADTLPIMNKTLGRFGSGTRYMNGLATTPLCGPARCSLLSGMYAHNHGATQNASAGAVFDQDHSVVKLLKQAGYTTGYVGKYINGWYGHGAPPHFDHFAIFKEEKEYYDTLWNVNGVEGREGRRSHHRRHATPNEEGAAALQRDRGRASVVLNNGSIPAPHALDPRAAICGRLRRRKGIDRDARSGVGARSAALPPVAR